MKNINILVYLLGIMLFAGACDLTFEPIDEIDNDKAFTNIDDLNSGLAGIMSQYGGHAIIANSDRASDDLRFSNSNRGQGVAVHDWTYNAASSDISGVWYGSAHIIDAANRLIAEAEKFNPEEEVVKRVVAECKFLRALSSFESVRFYCSNYEPESLGVPYVFVSEIVQPSRLSQKQSYEYILKDIDDAIPSLNQYSDDNPIQNSPGGNYWITKSAAYALKARVALYMRDWNMAINAAESAIGEGGFRLANIGEYANVWDDYVEKDVEVMFRLKRENYKMGDFYTSSANGDIYFHPSFGLMDIYDEDDVRKQAFFGTNENGKDIVVKHDGRPGDLPNVVDLKMFRVSEMILIKAEAYVELDKLDNAKTEITTLRQNRITDPADVDMSTKTLAMKVLQEERRRELAYEGHRFYDLRRWNLPVERLPEDSETKPSYLPAGDYHFVFPIPQDEMFANDNMVQNDGYSN